MRYTKILLIEGEIIFGLSLWCLSNIRTAIGCEEKSTIAFESGIYNFVSTIFISNVPNLTITGQEMDQTLLIGNAPIIILWLCCSCRQYLSRYIEVQLPHRSGIGSDAFQIFQTPPTNTNASLVSTGILRIPLRSPTKFALRDSILAIYNSQKHVIIAHYMTNFTI
ncbi:unnamed protein product [Rotaria socialis]|uniref:Uncharacterized protein n=1 Tax=Rotaria socialis TaxID=392032 RepID=A0A817XH54_9BILA|nr:unnamed protein product [Rotaria socialis]CAF4670337.1 unnamed protein product [Rotaria socialis]